MGKGARTRAATARERIALQQAAARKAEQRRKTLLISGSVGLVLVIVVGLIFAKTLFSSTTKQQGTGHLPASVATAVTTVPTGTLASIGTGNLPGISQYLKPISDKALTSAGKPEMLYIGAEFCPYCAAMRWSMAVALSRFGTFGPFTGIHSSSSDVYPNTATLTFYKQRYTSQFLTFVPVENQDVAHKTLQATTKAQLALWTKYDTTNGQVGFPFISFGNKVVLTGPLFSPQVLHGLSWTQIASQLKIPTSSVAINIVGAANYLTAAICKMTGDTPASVCKLAPVPAIEAKL